jgi:molecular chaperone GrpE
MTGAGGRAPRPRPRPGPGGSWVTERDEPGAAGAAGKPSAPAPRQVEIEGELGVPRDLGEVDESADLVDDGIAVGMAPPPRRTDAPTKGPDVVVGDILGDVAALERERDEYVGALQRLQADFENYRKRVQRQHHEESAKAALDLVNKLLPVLDTLDLAEAHLGAADEGAVSEEAKALSQARGQLLAMLAAEGLERVDEADVVFDPVVHDAVAGDPGTGTDETMIDEVMRSGYRWRGRVLRPAMVRVRS